MSSFAATQQLLPKVVWLGLSEFDSQIVHNRMGGIKTSTQPCKTGHINQHHRAHGGQASISATFLGAPASLPVCNRQQTCNPEDLHAVSE